MRKNATSPESQDLGEGEVIGGINLNFFNFDVMFLCIFSYAHFLEGL